MVAFTRTWNTSYESSPIDSQSASQGATRIRELKKDIRERLEVDHSWDGDTDDGAHKKLTLVEQSSDPAAVTNRIFLYTKESTDGKSEIFICDEDGDIMQLTSNGSFGMVGEVKCFAYGTPPTGWLECDGTAISRTTYAGLFAKIGTTFGNGDGATTFNIPDLRGEFLRGWDNGKGTDTGRTFGSSQTDEFKQHSHNASSSTAGDHSHTISTSGSGGGGGVGDASTGSSLSTSTAGAHNHTITVDDAGTADETRPTNVAMLFCIKY